MDNYFGGFFYINLENYYKEENQKNLQDLQNLIPEKIKVNTQNLFLCSDIKVLDGDTIGIYVAESTMTLTENIVFDGELEDYVIPIGAQIHPYVLPIKLKLKVRCNGYDTLETRPRRGKEKVQYEKIIGNIAKFFLKALVQEAKTILFLNPKWGKYGGRCVADIYIDGNSLLEIMTSTDRSGLSCPLAIAYEGKNKLDKLEEYKKLNACWAPIISEFN